MRLTCGVALARVDVTAHGRPAVVGAEPVRERRRRQELHELPRGVLVLALRGHDPVAGRREDRPLAAGRRPG